jgi:hypothetical protein
MSKSSRHKHKGEPSAYQRQVYFFTGMLIVLGALVIIGLLWLLNKYL